jgi:hypothetical protein
MKVKEATAPGLRNQAIGEERLHTGALVREQMYDR